MNKNFVERCNIKQIFVPGDISGGIEGELAGFSDGGRLAVVLHFAATVSLPATILLNLFQHSVDDSKVLSIANRYYYKKTGDTSFTEVKPDSASDEYDISELFGLSGGVLVLEILATDLDIMGGYTQASIDIVEIEDVVGYATLEVQDITYTANEIGLDGENISIAYEDTVSQGDEEVTVVGNLITVAIESGASTATQVKAAIDASEDALALISAEITGTAGDAQVTAAEDNLVAPAPEAVTKQTAGIYILTETKHKPCFDIIF